MNTVKSYFSNKETADTYDYLSTSPYYIRDFFVNCKSPSEIKYLLIDMWPDCAKEFIKKIEFEELFNIMVKS